MAKEKDVVDATKDYQESKGEKPDSGKDFSRAQHQFRQDYQKDGEPFGSMSNRDVDTKQDVPDKKK